MKKIFEYLGLLSLICFSFFLTEQTALVVKEVDDIMIQIKSEMEKYAIEGIDAKIEGNTIIPGLVSKEVNVDKSYNNMKEKGLYDSSFYVYDEIKPSISIDNNYNKYIISGNSKKNMVSLVFLIENKNIKDIQNIIGQIPVTYVIENYNFDNQIDNLQIVNNLDNSIAIKIDNNQNFNLIVQKLKSIGIDNYYCYNLNYNDNFLESCKIKKKHTVVSKQLINSQPLKNVKKELKAGQIFTFKITDELINELPNIISYIESRGYTIVNLEDHLSENW